MPEQNNLIDLFSKEWEEKCRDALEKSYELDKKKIPEAEKLWRIKQLLQEMVLKERRRVARPKKATNRLWKTRRCPNDGRGWIFILKNGQIDVEQLLRNMLSWII